MPTEWHWPQTRWVISRPAPSGRALGAAAASGGEDGASCGALVIAPSPPAKTTPPTKQTIVPFITPSVPAITNAAGVGSMHAEIELATLNSLETLCPKRTSPITALSQRTSFAIH
ncbi:hypothetical protein D3C80_1596990 [compost metagenome]